MTKNITEVRRLRRLRLFFVLAVFGILSATMLLLAIALAILLKLKILQVNVIEIDPWFLIFVLLLSSVVMGAVISVFVSRVVFSVANKLAEGLNMLAQGDFSVRLDLGKNMESKQLADVFNKLAEELQNTETLRADFINEFAHEFKTPIVSIKGFAELLQKRGLSEEQKKEYISIIIEESTRLSTLAANSLSLSRIEKQNILTEKNQYNLSEQIRSSVLLLEKKWSAKNLEPDLDFGEYIINANEELLKQVWINIIDNAIKFSFDNTKLVINCHYQDDTIAVDVKNIGVEIKEQDRSRIFEKFYRADTSHKTEGNGVGLAIVKKIVELHGGEVSVLSNSERTIFTVRLPNVKSL